MGERLEQVLRHLRDLGLSVASFELPLPGTGRFYVRLRARDPDGFLGPYTTPQYFDIAHCVRDSSGSCVRAGGHTLIHTP